MGAISLFTIFLLIAGWKFNSCEWDFQMNISIAAIWLKSLLCEKCQYYVVSVLPEQKLCLRLQQVTKS